MTTLDDASAIHILKTIAQARLRPAALEVAASPDLREALAAVYGSPSVTPTSEGDLARAALGVLAQDPAFAEPIQRMARQAAAGVPTSGQRYFEPTTIALTTAVLLVLQTRVKFKRDHTGKWSIEIEKKTAGDGAIEVLVQRLLSLLPG